MAWDQAPSSGEVGDKPPEQWKYPAKDVACNELFFVTL